MIEKYRTILIDPPWNLSLTGRRNRTKGGPRPSIPYQTMSISQIRSLPIRDISTADAHLWLWTTNQFLRDGFDLIECWGFKYLAPIHAIKKTGIGNWFVHRSQTMLFAYSEKCRFPMARYRPNVIEVRDPVRHSEKWDATYEYIESISPPPRLELFARRERPGWDAWGNEIGNSVSPPVAAAITRAIAGPSDGAA